MGERFSANGFVAGAGEDHSEGLLAELAAVQCLAAESPTAGSLPMGGYDFEGFSGGYGYGGGNGGGSGGGGGGGRGSNDGRGGGAMGVAALEFANGMIDGGGSGELDYSPSSSPVPPRDIAVAAVAGVGLSPSDVVAVSERILGLDRRLRALPTHRADFKRVIKMLAMRHGLTPYARHIILHSVSTLRHARRIILLIVYLHFVLSIGL